MTGGRPLRVLHCIQNLNYGGMERVLSDLCNGVDPERFESHVLTLQYRGRYSRELEGVATLHDGPVQGRLAMLWPRALIRTIVDIAPDVVHAHSGVWYKIARASRRAGVPRVVYTEHGRVGPETLTRRLLHGLAARLTDVTVAVSEATAEQLRSGAGIPAGRIRVIRNGIDTERFSPGESPFRRALGIPPETVLLGSVGRLEPVKDYATLLRALRLVLNHGPEVSAPIHLVVAGDGSQRAELLRLRGTLDLEDHVTFLGWWDDPEDLLRALDLFTLSSLSEGTSISLLEALSTGCCPVVTRVGGNPAVLGPDLAHRLVESADPESVAEGLARACVDERARREDGRRGRRRVRELFDLRSMVEAYSRLYKGG